jgi:hypothetical protein
MILRRLGGGRKILDAFFELDRGPIGQGRMEPAAVVDALDEGADRVAGLAQIAIVSAVDLLLLECLHEALRLGVVVGIADTAHARLDAMRFQYARVLATGVLHPVWSKN